MHDICDLSFRDETRFTVILFLDPVRPRQYEIIVVKFCDIIIVTNFAKYIRYACNSVQQLIFISDVEKHQALHLALVWGSGCFASCLH